MRFAIVVLVAMLAGCGGLTDGRIRDVPATTYSSAHSVDEVLSCLKPTLDGLGGWADVTTYPTTGRVEVDISAEQGFKKRDFYLITLLPSQTGSAAEIRSAGDNHGRISERELIDKVKSCV